MTDHGPQRQPASVPQQLASDETYWPETAEEEAILLRKEVVEANLDRIRLRDELARLRAENERLQKEQYERLIQLDAVYVKLMSVLDALKQYADIANWDYLPSRDSIWIGPGDNPEQLAADALRGEQSRPSGTPADVEDEHEAT